MIGDLIQVLFPEKGWTIQGAFWPGLLYDSVTLFLWFYYLICSSAIPTHIHPLGLMLMQLFLLVLCCTQQIRPWTSSLFTLICGHLHGCLIDRSLRNVQLRQKIWTWSDLNLLKSNSEVKQEHIFTADTIPHVPMKNKHPNLSYLAESLLPILKYHFYFG